MLKLIPGNAQHIGARKEQQDSFGFSDTRDTALVAHGGLVAAVADGMGGLEGGQQSSSIAVETFMAAYARKTPREPVPAALRRSLLEANRAVLAVARQAGTSGNTGTTFAAAAVHNDLLYWIATGDSRIYLLRDGVQVQVNADHTHGTTLWPAVAAGQLSREGALNDPQAPHLTSHLGMEELAHIDLSERPFPLQAGDVVVVCSDGIYRAVSEREMAEAFRAAGSPSAACSAIQASVLAKGSAKQDNLTILAIECRDPNPAPVTVRPTVVPVAARPTANGPSNLVLGGLFCIELLMAAGLGGNYVWGKFFSAPTPPTGASVTVARPVARPTLPAQGGQNGPSLPEADPSSDEDHLPASAVPSYATFANYEECKTERNPIWCRWHKFLRENPPAPTRLGNGPGAGRPGAGNRQADAPGTGMTNKGTNGGAIQVNPAAQSSIPAAAAGAGGGGGNPSGSGSNAEGAGPAATTASSPPGAPAPKAPPPPPGQEPKPAAAPDPGAPVPTNHPAKPAESPKTHQVSEGDQK